MESAENLTFIKIVEIVDGKKLSISQDLPPEWMVEYTEGEWSVSKSPVYCYGVLDEGRELSAWADGIRRGHPDLYRELWVVEVRDPRAVARRLGLEFLRSVPALEWYWERCDRLGNTSLTADMGVPYYTMGVGDITAYIADSVKLDRLLWKEGVE